MASTEERRARAKQRFVLAYIITGVWVVSFVLEALDRTYDPSPIVHTLMLIVAGAIFGEAALRGSRNGRPNGASP